MRCRVGLHAFVVEHPRDEQPQGPDAKICRLCGKRTGPGVFGCRRWSAASAPRPDPAARRPPAGPCRHVVHSRDHPFPARSSRIAPVPRCASPSVSSSSGSRCLWHLGGRGAEGGVLRAGAAPPRGRHRRSGERLHGARDGRRRARRRGHPAGPGAAARGRGLRVEPAAHRVARHGRPDRAGRPHRSRGERRRCVRRPEGPSDRGQWWASPVLARSSEARISFSASSRPTHSAPSTDLPGSRSL